MTEDELRELRLSLRIRVLEDVVGSLLQLLREVQPESVRRWEEKLDLWATRARWVKTDTTEEAMLHAGEYQEAVQRLSERLKEALK